MLYTRPVVEACQPSEALLHPGTVQLHVRYSCGDFLQHNLVKKPLFTDAFHEEGPQHRVAVNHLLPGLLQPSYVDRLIALSGHDLPDAVHIVALWILSLTHQHPLLHRRARVNIFDLFWIGDSNPRQRHVDEHTQSIISGWQKGEV